MSMLGNPPLPLVGDDSERPSAKIGKAGLLARLNAIEVTPKKVKRPDLMHFSRMLAVFLRAGVPLLEALENISSETGNKFFRSMLDDIVDRLKAGSTFADAAAAHGEAFPSYYLSILRSAELTGNLDVVLVQLSDYLERDLEAKRKVSSALTYPAIIGCLSVVVVIVLTVYVLPKFEVFFASLDAKLPLPTRMLLGFSKAIRTWWFVPVGLALLLLTALFWLTQKESGKAVRDRLLLRVPVLGDLIRHAVLERFCRILASMVTSGVAMPDAILTAADGTSNRVYVSGLMRAREGMMRGEGLATPLIATGLFPAAARQMFRVGEDTGSLDDQLVIAAEFYARELDHRIKKFTALFEPIIIVAMGIVVGFVAIALVSAMYGIYHQVKV